MNRFALLAVAAIVVIAGVVAAASPAGATALLGATGPTVPIVGMNCDPYVGPVWLGTHSRRVPGRGCERRRPQRFPRGRVSAATQAASTDDLCVGSQPYCFSTVQAALDAAQNGDSIAIGPGTFAGGVTITKSVSLVGVSAGATTIEGGAPVLTIGDGTANLTVSISRVTITGGFNASKPESQFGPGFFTAGGGVLIPEAADHTTGATVTISDSVISGNRVAAGPPQPVCGNPCSFASGGGIANWGTLTVTNTRIDGNVAGSTATSGGLATDARGGGIWNSSVGAVTLRHSFVTGNRAAVSAPNGRFAEGGGINDDGTLTIADSVVNDNACDASTAVPNTFPFEMQAAVGGGIRITDRPGSNATITGTTISGNNVASINLGGDASANSGGLDVDGSLLLVDSRVDRNTVRTSVPPSSGNLASAAFAGIEVTGAATIRNTSISGNLATAVSATGPAIGGGVGIANLSGQVTLEHALVIGNRGSYEGSVGLPFVGGGINGGGILNTDFGGGPPELTISDSVVTANELTTTTGIAPRGGGIFSANVFAGDPIPFTLTRTIVAGNKPEECFGC
jgi:hypothetical protein